MVLKVKNLLFSINFLNNISGALISMTLNESLLIRHFSYFSIDVKEKKSRKLLFPHLKFLKKHTQM